MLTDSELKFLGSQGLSAEDVYDARGQSMSYWKAAVRKAGLTLVLGATCSKGGHRLRSRSGHCVQCDTSKISYQRRHHTVGYVYIAGSQRGRLIKLGTAVDIDQREQNLRGQSYAGFNDWTMLFSTKVAAGGHVEHLIQAELARYHTDAGYEKDGRSQAAGEVFRTNFTTAINAAFKVLKGQSFDEPWRSSRWSEYDWQ